MSTNELSPEQIATAVSQAEDLAQEGRYEEASECAIATLPEITMDNMPVALERNRIKLRIFHVLNLCPHVQFFPPEREEVMRVTEEIMGESEKFEPIEIVKAHVAYCTVLYLEDFRQKIKRERREFDALQAAYAVLNKTESTEADRALAHFLICKITLENDELEKNLRDLFAIRTKNRPFFVTADACTTVPSHIHLQTNMRYLNMALDEMTDMSPHRARLLLKKVQVLIQKVIAATADEEVCRWHDEHGEEFHALSAELLSDRKVPIHIRALLLMSLAWYGVACREEEMAFLQMNIASAMARENGDEELAKIVAEHRAFLEEEMEESTDDEEDGESWWKKGRNPPF